MIRPNVKAPLYIRVLGERGREQIERERRKEVRRVEDAHSNLSHSTIRIGEHPFPLTD